MGSQRQRSQRNKRQGNIKAECQGNSQLWGDDALKICSQVALKGPWKGLIWHQEGRSREQLWGMHNLGSRGSGPAKCLGRGLWRNVWRHNSFLWSKHHSDFKRQENLQKPPNYRAWSLMSIKAWKILNKAPAIQHSSIKTLVPQSSGTDCRDVRLT